MIVSDTKKTIHVIKAKGKKIDTAEIYTKRDYIIGASSIEYGRGPFVNAW